MYINGLTIKNIRSIDHLKVEFETLGDSLVFTGANGSGKSTVLKCIAMGIVDEDSAASVLRALDGELVRKGEDEGSIAVDLEHSDGSKYRINTKIVSQEMFEKVYQRVYEFKDGKYKQVAQEDFPWYAIFATGYGAGLRTIGTTDYKYYVAIDALYSLFNHSAELQNPELSLRRMIAMAEESGKKNAGKEILEHVIHILENVLQLGKDDDIVLTSSSIEIAIKNKGQFELNTMGDGYVSIVTMLLDMFSWWMLHVRIVEESILDNKKPVGIVVVDEIEKHLYPNWQKKIFNLLKTSLPRVQFIMSTNSKFLIENSTINQISI